MGRPAALPSSSSSGLMSIGHVLAILTPEFPDLTSSKLRFLEEQGLVTPARTASGYRKFSARDVERLRQILTLQRDHYLPLKVIKTYVCDSDDPVSDSPSSAVLVSMLSSTRRLRRDDLIREAQATPALFDDAMRAGLISAAESYGDDVLNVLIAIVRLARTGIEPRHLRSFRVAAQREVDLIETALVPLARRKDVTAKPRSADLAREIAGHLDVVRASVVRSSLDRLHS